MHVRSWLFAFIHEIVFKSNITAFGPQSFKSKHTVGSKKYLALIRLSSIVSIATVSIMSESSLLFSTKSFTSFKLLQSHLTNELDPEHQYRVPEFSGIILHLYKNPLNKNVNDTLTFVPASATSAVLIPNWLILFTTKNNIYL